MLSTQATNPPDEQTHSHTTSYNFDTVIVFGEGPVKTVLLPEEATAEQHAQWKAYRADPLHHPEPNFWIMQQPRQLAQLEKIARQKDLSEIEKAQLQKQLRRQWQQTGWFGMKQWGRQNALAAGLALYKGLTARVILSGGKTMSLEVKARLSEEALADWPSEAALMAEIIVSTYGSLYEKKYGHPITEAIIIEDSSTNTLENFAYTVNRYPELLQKEYRIGFLTAGHHLNRVTMLGHLFSIYEAEGGKLCAQEMLRTMAIDDTKESVSEFLSESKTCPDNSKLTLAEKRWTRGLQDPEYLTYWLGYVALVKHPRVLQKVIERICEEEWKDYTKKTLSQVGIDLDQYQTADLAELAKNQPEKFTYLVDHLQQLRSPQYRVLPPAVNE